MPGKPEHEPEKPWRTVVIGDFLEDAKKVKKKPIKGFRLMNEDGILDKGGTEEDNLIGVYRGGSKDYGTGAKNIDYIIYERKNKKDTGVQFLLPYNTIGRWYDVFDIFQFFPDSNIVLKTLDSSNSSKSGNNLNNHLKIYLKF